MHSRTTILALLLLIVSMVAGLAVACSGGASENQADASRPAPSPAWEIRSKDVKFDHQALTVPADVAVSIRFINDDAGILHNVAVYKDKSAKEKVFSGELITGKNTIDYSFEAPSAGTYFFRCDTHPDMNGPFYVEGAVGQTTEAPF